MYLVKRTWQFAAPILGACVLGYFLYHTVEGERGWVTQMNLQQQVMQAQEHLDRLHQEREGLEHRVKLMRPQSLDPDLLEEQARKTLNYSRPNEIVILTPQDKAPQNQ